MKNILFGNGINIQFGGTAYNSEFILKRVRNRIVLDKYQDKFDNVVKQNELLNLFDGFINVANDIRSNKYDNLLFNEDEITAINDFKNRYQNEITKSHEVLLEDWFFLLHIFIIKNSDLIKFEETVKQGFIIMFLDSIFNDGKIQYINSNIPIKVKRFISEFDNIFTLNYDNNIEKLLNREVYHLHGDFSNALLDYNGKSKYEAAKAKSNMHSKCDEYYFDIFEGIEGDLSIIGMSPNNDSHLFNIINKNDRLNNVVFYYYSDVERDYVENNYPLFQCKSIRKLWEKLGANKNYRTYDHILKLSKGHEDILDCINELSKDKIPYVKIVKNINKISKSEMSRLYNLVKVEMSYDNGQSTITLDELLKQYSKISHIALSEGIYPSVLYLICLMKINN